MLTVLLAHMSLSFLIFLLSKNIFIKVLLSEFFFPLSIFKKSHFTEV